MTPLPELGEDPRYWTAAEAAALLGPPQLSVLQVRQLTALCSIPAAGKRKAGPRALGRHPRVFEAEALIRAFDAIYSVTSSDT